MKPKTVLVLLAVLACTVLPIVAMFGYEAYRTRNLAADIIARAPEKGNFSPREVRVAVGKKAKIRVRNADTVMHGFAIPALGIDAGEISAGGNVILEFTPQRVGTYDFYCTTWCSDYHLQMRGTLRVVASEAEAQKRTD
jgi:heme/copper-type cytochrome/quinol oxidase subunit 2